jgi:hypothetical protein
MAAGQTEIFRETMGTTSSQVNIPTHEANNGFDNDNLTMTTGGATRSALVSGTNASSISNYSGASGKANIYFGVSTETYGFAIEGINASGYSNLCVQFGYRKEDQSNPAPLSFQYWNGTNYVNLTISFLEPTNAPAGWYLSPEIFLPPEACMDGLKLRWLKSGTSRTARIDDVVLKSYSNPLLMVDLFEISNLCQIENQEPLGLSSFILSGVNLTGEAVNLSANQGFTLSESAGGLYSGTISLEGYTGFNKEIWVGFGTYLQAGDYQGQIELSGGGAECIQLPVSGRVYQNFDIPYYNGFRAPEDLLIANKLGFITQNAEYMSAQEGYLGLTYLGYITTPEINLLPHSHLDVRFQSNATGQTGSIALEGYISYSGGPFQFIFSTGSMDNVFNIYNYSIQLQNSESQTTARIKFQKTNNSYSYIRFRELSIRDLSDWTGTESTDWNTESNWTLGVPGIKSEVIIPSALNNPVLDGEGFAGDLTLAENATLTINPQGRLSIGGSLTNPNGTAGLVIEDGGSLIHPNAGVPATVKRNIAAANWTDCTDGWHLISAPVENQAIEGGWTPTGPDNDYDFFAWSEPQQLWLNQKESGNEMSRFIPGEGYLVAYQQGGTKIFAGNLTVGDITRTLTLTGDDDFSGWNLLGNPYPSGLRWNHDTGIWGDLQALNINAYAHTWDAVAKSYTVVPPGGFIPAGQGFMVQLTGGESADLTLPTAARAHEGPPEDRSAANGWIRLAAFEQDNASKQECLLMINPAATETYQPYWDAHFLQGFAPQFYSLKNDEKLTVFSMPEIDMDQAIPLGFVKNEAGAFRINLLENNTTESLFLYDIKLDTEQVLSLDNPYLFTAEADDDPLRFELRFKSANTTGIERQIQEGAEVYTSGKVLFLKFLVEENGRTLEVFDPGGRRLLAKPLSEGRQHSISLDLEAGLYIVRLRAKRWTVSKKIFVI